ncbi:astaxanthin synthase [Phaffia rhodozyma]|uniref:Astaxanthin synthase n=3 Tax=Phaffia rhodozyma TaxID=264483 RepID=Q3HR17_PHARH|nr:astaxanthin synthetase [Phaffia rhodozyma]AEA35044.1 astaxanthin synthase [synthetic construct]AAY20975.1 astaxanthin synthetase [Phaffia rhodozyma]ABA43719.1 b-carotene oxygenase [Phaffia rhodozyma]ABB16282.1 cytochrome-450 hydroxylase [Phaffia rhodozyma]
MFILVLLTGALGLAAFSWASIAFFSLYLAPRRSSLYNLQGPNHTNYFTGNFLDILSARTGEEHAKYREKYGSTLRFAGIAGAPVLNSTDPKVFNHVMKEAYDYPKPGMAARVLRIATGDGVVTAEGEAHKRHRRIMIPSLSAQAVKSMVPIFLEKGMELVDKMMEDAAEKDMAVGESAGEKKATRLETEGVDVKDWVGRATLDVMALAGFDYKSDSLQNKTNELYVAFVGLTDGFAPTLDSFKAIMWDFVPYFRTMKRRHEIPLTQGLAVSRRVGIELMEQKKQAVLGSASDQAVDKKDVQGRDILSLLVRANIAANLPESQKLSDEEVLAQISNLLFAGYETSSTVLTWMFHRLSEDKAVQDKLREEICQIDTDMPTLDELNALPYLEAFVKESLRLDPPSPYANRECLKDEDFIPLAEPVIGRDGSVINEVRITKGTMVMLPLFNINRSKFIYGEDAEEFRPERWLEDVTDSLNSIEAPYGHQASFISGPRACFGWRFAVAEMKAFLFVTLRRVQFEPIISHPEYEHITLIISRPRIVGREKEGYQMRLQVKPVE